MRTRLKPHFLRYFVGGFAIGAICVIGSQVAHAEAQPAPSAPFVQTAY